MNAVFRTATIFIIGAALLSPSGLAIAGDADQKDNHPVEDAWIDGKLEAAYTLNRHLNPFSIHTDVSDGVVVLTGNVESDIDRDLAGEIAQSINGVVSVENRLEVAPDEARKTRTAGVDDEAEAEGDRQAKDRDFAQVIGDATTTAQVKTKLMANANVKARDINVDTFYNRVTLTGRVDTEEQRELAELIARNTTDVREVENRLTVATEVAGTEG